MTLKSNSDVCMSKILPSATFIETPISNYIVSGLGSSIYEKL